MADTKKEWFFNCTSQTSGATNTHIKSFTGVTNIPGIGADYSTNSTDGALYQTVTDSQSHRTKVTNIVCQPGYKLANYSGQSGCIRYRVNSSNYYYIGEDTWSDSFGGALWRIDFNTAYADYVITLNKNSGSGGYSYVYTTYNTGVYDSSARTYQMTTSANNITTPTRTGYTFKGYYSDTSGGTRYIDSNGYITSSGITAGKGYTSDQTWYAQWQPNTLTVQFNANGGTGSMSAETFTYDTAKALTANSFTAPTGYTFGGWATSSANATAGTVKYSNKQSVTNPNGITSGSTTLYAIWYRNIKFYSGNNKGTTTTIKQYYDGTNSKGANITTATATNCTNISGWTELGWRDDTTAGAKEYNFNTSISPSVTSYYAVYSRSVTFYHGYNKAGSTSVTQYYNSSNVYSCTTPASTVCTSINYWTPIGWRDDTTAIVELFGFNQAITNSSNIFYAIYNRTINFYYFEGATSTTRKNSGRIQYLNSGNTTVSSVVSYPLYTNQTYGWSPLGWRTDTNASTASTSQTGTTTVNFSPAYNISPPAYYAVYSRSIAFAYNANGGGTAPSNTTGTQYYNADNSIASTVSLKTANAIARDGYSQTKWALDSPTGTTNYNVNTNYNFPSTSWDSNATRTLYAIWIVNEKPGIHINVSGLFQLAAPYIFCKRGSEANASWHKMAPYVWDGSAWRLCGEKGAVAQVIKFTSIFINGSSTVATGNGTEYTITASPSDATNQQVVVTVSGDGYFGTNTSTKTQTVVLSGGSGTVIIKSNAQGTTSTGTITVRPVVADSDSVSASKSVTYAANVVKFSTIVIEGDDTVSASGTTYTVRATPANATNQNVTITITGLGYLGTTAGTTSQTITLSGGVGTFKITSTAQNTNGTGTITATPEVATSSSVKATKSITYSATIVKFTSITISGNDTVAQNGTTYTISASPTNAANQSVTVSLTGNGYFDFNTSTISKNITLVNGTQTVVISSKAGTAGTQGVITATPAVAQTSGLKATKNVTYEATKFTTITVSPDSEQTIAYHGTKTFTVTATPSYAGPQYVYLYDATASAGYTSISGTGITAGSYTLNSQNTSAVCQYKLTLTNGVGSFTVTNNSSSTADEHGAVFVYTVLPSSTNTVELSTSTGILTLSKNPDAQLTLQSFSDAFDVWRTGSTVNSRWLYANTTTAVPTNTNLPVLSDSDTTTGIQVQGKSAFAGGTADVDLDLTLQNAVLTHTPEEINTINIICQTTMTNGSTTNYYSFKITMNNQESSVISDLTSSNGRVSTYAPSVSFTDAQKTAIVNAIKSSSNGKTFSLVNTVHGHANYTFSGTVNVQLLSLSIVIGYKAYA